MMGKTKRVRYEIALYNHIHDAITYNNAIADINTTKHDYIIHFVYCKQVK